MAGTKPLRRVRSDDKAVNALQDHAEQLDKVSLLNGQLVSGVFPASYAPGFIAIRHSLGRSYLGAFVCGVDGILGATLQAFVPIAPQTAIAMGVDTSAYLALTASVLPITEQTVTLWVF